MALARLLLQFSCTRRGPCVAAAEALLGRVNRGASGEVGSKPESSASIDCRLRGRGAAAGAVLAAARVSSLGSSRSV